MIHQQINFGSKVIKYQLQHSNRKTLGIQVKPSGQVVVTAPMDSGLREIKSKVRHKAPWILKQVTEFDKYKPALPARRYLSGESHLYLGRQYRLKVVKDKTPAVKLYRGQLIMYTTKTDAVSLQKQLEGWYLQRAKDVFHQILEYVFPKFKRYLKAKPSLSIRKMKTRWGSCTPAGRIILNPELIKAPKGCIEYVIVHELCHVKYHAHNKFFYELLNKSIPGWKSRKQNLDSIATIIQKLQI